MHLGFLLIGLEIYNHLVSNLINLHRLLPCLFFCGS